LVKRYLKNVRYFLPVLGLAALCLSATVAEPKEDTNAKIKAVYLYNFSKYVEWPEDWKSGSFVVTVIGNNSSLLSELGKMAQKMVGAQQISVKSVSSVSSLDHSHIVFIPLESSGMLNEVINKVRGSSTLIVTEKQGLARQGSAINFIIKDNKQAFEINKSNAERYKLKINSNLMKLGTLVE